MTKKLAVPLLAAVCLVLLPGCIVDARDPYPGNVTFAWSFDGYGCIQEPDIQTVRVTIPGERLDNDGFYPCRLNGYDGITLYDFAPGYYDFYLEAIDYDGYVSFTRRGSFRVDGNVTVPVDLYPTL